MACDVDCDSVQRLVLEEEIARLEVVYREASIELGRILNLDGTGDSILRVSSCRGIVTSSFESLVTTYTRLPVGCVTICSAVVMLVRLSVAF